MSNVPSIASSHSAYASEAPAQPARAKAGSPRQNFNVVPDNLRDRLDPNMRMAETAVNNGANPTVVRYLAMEEQRRRQFEKKSPFGQLLASMKRKSKDRRSMDRLMHNEEALKAELRTLNDFVDQAWKRAQECYRVGDVNGAKVHTRQVLDYSRKADDVKLSLATVQGDEDMLVKQMSTSRLMRAHAETVRALKNTPDDTQQLEDRLKILEEVKDRAHNNDDLLREKIEEPADEDAAMQFLMQKLGQTTQSGLETENLARPMPEYEAEEEWQPLYQ